MNKTQLLLLVILFFTLTGCKKKYQSNPSLPPATQTGADTFGCLIDGKVLIPQDDHSAFCFTCSSPLYVFYSPYMNNSAYNQENLTIGASDENPDGPWRSVYLRVKNTAFIESQTIALKADTVKKGGSASYNSDILGNYSLVDYKTTQIISGELTITKIDLINKFISGTFKFDAINSNKDIVHVTDGRFDAHYQ
jgi:hypothetical protein